MKFFYMYTIPYMYYLCNCISQLVLSDIHSCNGTYSSEVYSKEKIKVSLLENMSSHERRYLLCGSSFSIFKKIRLIISSPLYKVISYPHKPSIGSSSKKTVHEAVVSIWQRELHRNTILSLKISILFTLFFHLLLSNHHYYLNCRFNDYILLYLLSL